MNPSDDRLRRHRRGVLVVCAALWGAALAVTHLPAGCLPRTPASDPVLHGAGYFFLSVALWLTLWVYGRPRRLRVAIILLAIPIYAAIDEITQPLVGRHASAADWAADVAGVLAALVLCELIALCRRPR